MVIAHIGAGADKKTCVLEKDVLEQHSDYFIRTLSMSSSSNGAYEIVLLEVDPEIFNVFRHFIRSGQIYSSQDDDCKVSSSDDGKTTDREWARLIDSWILGQRLKSCSFKDVVVDGIIDKVLKEECYPPDIQEDIYPQCHKSSAIRRLVVDIAMRNHDEETMAKQGYKKYLARCYFDLAKAMHAYKKDGFPEKAPYQGQDTCKYYEHESEGKACYKTMRWG